MRLYAWEETKRHALGEKLDRGTMKRNYPDWPDLWAHIAPMMAVEDQCVDACDPLIFMERLG